MVFLIDPDGAPRPDNFYGKFYQACLDIIRSNVHNVALDYFNRYTMPRAFQGTLLVLLPKKDFPSTCEDF